MGRRSPGRCGVWADSVLRMGIIDELLAHPGIYLGVNRDADGVIQILARIVGEAAQVHG